MGIVPSRSGGLGERRMVSHTDHTRKRPSVSAGGLADELRDSLVRMALPTLGTLGRLLLEMIVLGHGRGDLKALTAGGASEFVHGHRFAPSNELTIARS